jgi:glycosyltransferase involved in cell wall biosynthesis
MNILFVTQFRIDANRGGVQRVTESLSREFARRPGTKVYYLSLGAGKDEVIDNIPQFYIANPRSIEAPENVSYLRKLISDREINVIINQAGIYPKPLQLLKSSIDDQVKLVSVHHNCISCLQKNYENIIREHYKGSKIFKLIDNPVGWRVMKYYNRVKYGRYFTSAMKKSDKLVLLSHRFVPELSDYNVTPVHGRVEAIPNPAPFAVVDGVEAKKQNRLLFVGRLNYQQKRANLLIDIWKQLYLKFPDWSLDVVGDGPKKDELVRNAEREGLQRITFHGFQDPKPFLEKAKIFCLTSAFEGYGMVLVEAQAYGVVPVSFNCFSALPDIIQSGTNGIIVRKFDLNQYISELHQLMEDENGRKQMARHAQVSVKEFEVSKVADVWLKLFEDLNSGKRD